jgi:hypothetical protein
MSLFKMAAQKIQGFDMYLEYKVSSLFTFSRGSELGERAAFCQ